MAANPSFQAQVVNTNNAQLNNTVPNNEINMAGPNNGAGEPTVTPGAGLPMNGNGQGASALLNQSATAIPDAVNNAENNANPAQAVAPLVLQDAPSILDHQVQVARANLGQGDILVPPNNQENGFDHNTVNTHKAAQANNGNTGPGDNAGNLTDGFTNHQTGGFIADFNNAPEPTTTLESGPMPTSNTEAPTDVHTAAPGNTINNTNDVNTGMAQGPINSHTPMSNLTQIQTEHGEEGGQAEEPDNGYTAGAINTQQAVNYEPLKNEGFQVGGGGDGFRLGVDQARVGGQAVVEGYNQEQGACGAVQEGGSSPFNFITDPDTNQTFSIFSNDGKALLKSYVKAYKNFQSGGGRKRRSRSRSRSSSPIRVQGLTAADVALLRAEDARNRNRSRNRKRASPTANDGGGGGGANTPPPTPTPVDPTPPGADAPGNMVEMPRSPVDINQAGGAALLNGVAPNAHGALHDGGLNQGAESFPAGATEHTYDAQQPDWTHTQV
jgi:hypothetical protein